MRPAKRKRRIQGRGLWCVVVAFGLGVAATGAWFGNDRAATRTVRIASARLAAAKATPRRCSAGKTMNIVAHEDDDLLFLSPDLLRDVRSGRCVRTVFVTAGDAAERVGGTADQRSVYWHAREAGSRAAYALMSGVKDSWKRSHVVVDGHRIVMFTLAARPKVSLMFLRLPDGNPDGSGSRFHDHESLLKLRSGQIKVIHAINGSTSYTKAGLLATITRLVVSYHPDVIRAQDYVSPDYAVTRDHSDHTTTAILAHAASDAYRAPHAFIGYLDYNVDARPANVGGRVLAAKQAAFYAYDRHDSQLRCYTEALRTNGPDASTCRQYAVWLQRSYRITFTPSWNQPCLIPQVGGEELLNAEEQIRGAGCSVGDVRSSDDKLLSPTEVDDNLGTPVDFTTPSPDTKFLPQGTAVSIELESPPSSPGP